MPIPVFPKPILFHALKHHELYIREFIRLQHMTDKALLKSTLRTIGSSQLDLYLGSLSPLQIATETVAYLQEQGALEREAYRHFISGKGTDYRVFTLSDGSDWVLRLGAVADRYVHLHPARYSRDTVRIKANILKTAVAANMAILRYKQPLSLELINLVRTQWLELSPLKEYVIDGGLSNAIAMLSA
jgi:hypothetical protein